MKSIEVAIILVHNQLHLQVASMSQETETLLHLLFGPSQLSIPETFMHVLSHLYKTG